MDERILFKACLTLSLIGILLLSVYAENITLKSRQISEITSKDIDKQIKIAGYAARIKDLPGIALLNLKDKTGEVVIVIFKEENLSIKQNDFLEIEGFVKEYKGELEIQAEKITKK